VSDEKYFTHNKLILWEYAYFLKNELVPEDPVPVSLIMSLCFRYLKDVMAEQNMQ